MRFLTAYCAVQEHIDVVLTGSERMQERPIGQLVEALRSVGASIDYLGKEGYPPLHIKPPSHPPLGGSKKQIDLRGQQLDSTQFVSALLLVGFDVLTDEESPYITMTQSLIEQYQKDMPITLERDWSAASYWYEYVALYGGEITLPDLYFQTLQGDVAVAEIFEQLGVETREIDGGIVIARNSAFTHKKQPIEIPLHIDFSTCPDLYPAVYVTCHKLGIPLKATGTERLLHKESNRLQVFEQLDEERRTLRSYGDHRVAMALLVAGYQVDDVKCVSKSYPQFVEQLRNVTFVVPYKEQAPLPSPHEGGNPMQHPQQSEHIIYVNDEGRGKKYALRKGVEQAQTEYVWLTDIDVERECYPLFIPPRQAADLNILPLRMKSVNNASLLSRLQQTEYLAIQSLTMLAAERNHAVMCSGANLLVRREAWLASYAYLHTDIPSGDDMFLLESMKRRGLTIRALYEPNYIASITPQTTWSNLLKQRMRWAGKATIYTDRDIVLCGALTVLANLLALPLLPIKYAADLAIIYQAPRYNLITRAELRTRKIALWAFVLELLYPFYMLICLIGGLFRKSKW